MPPDPNGKHAAIAERRVLAILVTYRRPRELAIALDRLRRSDPRPDRLVVFDNAPTPENRSAVEGIGDDDDPWVEYQPMPANLGPAGARAAGMSRLLESADDSDLIVLLDDDDPLPDGGLLGALCERVDALERSDPHFGGLALRGGLAGYVLRSFHR